VLDILAEPEDA